MKSNNTLESLEHVNAVIADLLDDTQNDISEEKEIELLDTNKLRKLFNQEDALKLVLKIIEKDMEKII